MTFGPSTLEQLERRLNGEFTVETNRVDDGTQPFFCKWEARYRITFIGATHNAAASITLDLRDGSELTNQLLRDRPRRLPQMRRDISTYAELTARTRALKTLLEAKPFLFTNPERFK